jgi:hypothetical protein
MCAMADKQQTVPVGQKGDRTAAVGETARSQLGETSNEFDFNQHRRGPMAKYGAV